MPYKSKGKCVYKKNTGKKVGCTKGKVKDYLAALAINVKTENMENKLKGGKADKMSPKDIADKFDVTTKMVNDQIKKGKKIESEHTDDEEKQTEIAEDHVSEFPDYYDRIEKMEKEAKKYWGKKEKTNESKTLIKKLLRENLIPSLKGDIKDQLYNQMEKLGIEPNEVSNITINGKEVNLHNNEGPIDTVKKIGLACTLVAGMLSCQKEESPYSYNIGVKGTEYTIVGNADENTTLTPEEEKQGISIVTVSDMNGNPRTFKVKFLKDQRGTPSSGGWVFDEEPTPIEFAILSFGMTKPEEMRSNRFFTKGATIVDYIPSEPTKQGGYSTRPESIRDQKSFKNAIEYIKKGPIQQKEFNKEMKQKGIPITAQEAIDKYGNN